MINKLKKIAAKRRRAERSRFKLRQSSSRPRLVFNKSNRYLSCQIVDDVQGTTLVAASTLEATFAGKSRKDKEAAKALGKAIGERAASKGVKVVMLDRSGMIYHGRIAAFADSAREAGLEF
ncbi:50S ribosomal protein L18 [Leptospira hartskeerlii]|uniref:Large ribosomal subunit protein uL18 n=1 Tax=Leptospira hartskeerlii TaxID=2023177 RepID=A0A2M9XGG5_9LEPT|nr:50S ribosomal protein L18 [Leptospira hartskeerlii]PJZ26744.1 50S ribosomal protein L18 [Leptospira hartskeerlii]PJZ34774.1 50S ribosomal protein L18 [Leptospira hartskeerlii]